MKGTELSPPPNSCISSRVEKGLWVMNWVFSELIRKPNRVEARRNGAAISSACFVLCLQDICE